MAQYTYNNAPTINAPRTLFEMPHRVLTSMQVGKLTPIDLQEVLPGDTFKMDNTIVCRVSSAFLKPVMDNLYLDIYHFFVPHRLSYDRFEEVFGENKNGYWANEYDVTIPVITSGPTGTIEPGSVLDYLGVQPGVGTTPPVNVLGPRGLARIWNDWFRDENNQQPCNIITGARSYATELPNGNDWSPTNYFGMLPPVAKYHDYFTSCLPAPQKGNAVELPLAVSTNVVRVTPGPGSPVSSTDVGDSTLWPLELKFNGPSYTEGSGNLLAAHFYNGHEAEVKPGSLYDTSGIGAKLIGTNLVARTNEMNFEPISVNDLRMAFALQRMLEADARGGSRYTEYIHNFFNVQSPDGRLQRPEYLGGKRIPLNVQQVAQTSAGTDLSALGEVGAYSLTNGETRVNKAFTEHGYIYTLACIRYRHTYQGVEKHLMRKRRTDFYQPVFAHIGEQPVYQVELIGDDTVNELGEKPSETIFGYQEAWADYRIRPNKVTGQMRPLPGTVNSTIGQIYTFADNPNDYSDIVISNGFIVEDSSNVDRTIAVDSDNLDPFILDFYFDVKAIREIPPYSVPGGLMV